MIKKKQWPFCKNYKSQIKKKWEPISFFYTKEEYKPSEIKYCLFLISLSLNLAVGEMFFNNWTMHRIYMDRGDYNLHYQLKINIASMLISALLTSAVESFISS